jgi:hypothetical protein
MPSTWFRMVDTRRLCCASLLSRIVVAENVFWVLRWKHVDGIASPRTSVFLSRSGEPPHRAEKTDEGCHTDGIVHVVGSDWLDGREEEHNTNEADPCHCDCIDRLAPSAHCVWTRVENHSTLVPSMCNDNRDVADIQGGRGDVENSRDR